MLLPQLRRVRWAVRATLVLGVAVSVVANILHALHNPISQSIAAWPPLALLLTVELISRVPVHRKSLAFCRLLATAIIAGIAAWVSYWHMAGVASRYGETGASPYLLPLSVDGLIVVASICLVELGGRISSLELEAQATSRATREAAESAAWVTANTQAVFAAQAAAPVPAQRPAEAPVPVPAAATTTVPAAPKPTRRLSPDALAEVAAALTPSEPAPAFTPTATRRTRAATPAPTPATTSVRPTPATPAPAPATTSVRPTPATSVRAAPATTSVRAAPATTSVRAAAPTDPLARATARTGAPAAAPPARKATSVAKQSGPAKTTTTKIERTPDEYVAAAVRIKAANPKVTEGDLAAELGLSPQRWRTIRREAEAAGQGDALRLAA